MPRVLTQNSVAPRTLSETRQTPATGLVPAFTPPATPGYSIYEQAVTPRVLTEAPA